MQALANKNGLDIRGHLEDRVLAYACQADMIKEQKSWFGDSINIIDINQALGKSVITMLELCTYFADFNIFPHETIITITVSLRIYLRDILSCSCTLSKK